MASVVKLKDLIDALVSACEKSGDGSLNLCVSGLENFFTDIEDSDILKKALESPVIATAEKTAIVEDLCRLHGFSDVLRNFLVAVAGFDKLKPLSIRRRAVLERLRSAGGTVKVTVTVARSLEEDKERRIRDAVSSIAGMEKQRVEFAEDSEIIGGIIVRIGNNIYDDSLKTHLERMRSALLK